MPRGKLAVSAHDVEQALSTESLTRITGSRPSAGSIKRLRARKTEIAKLAREAGSSPEALEKVINDMLHDTVTQPNSMEQYAASKSIENSIFPMPSDMPYEELGDLLEKTVDQDKGLYIMIIGRPASGKTSVQRLLLKLALDRDIWKGCLYISPSASDNKPILDVLPEQRLTSSEFRSDMLAKYMSWQLDLVKKYGSSPSIAKLNAVFVSDDVLGKAVHGDDSIMQAFARGRHARMSIIVNMQGTTLANSHWRSMAYYVICTGLNSRQDREPLIEHLLRGLLPFDGSKSKELQAWDAWLEAATADHHAVLIDARKISLPRRIAIPKLEDEIK